MIIVKIGVSELRFESVREIDNNWISQQIRLQRSNGHMPCIRVVIHQGSVNMVLATLGCPNGGGFRQPNRDEEKVFEIWKDLGLNHQDLNEHKLIVFFQRIRRFF